MSSHLPYVVPGSVVPGQLYHIPRAGYTSRPMSHDPKDAIRQETTAIPDTFRHKAEAAGSMRLKDDNLVKVIQQALQKEGASKQQTQTTDKQALPSDLAWRG